MFLHIRELLFLLTINALMENNHEGIPYLQALNAIFFLLLALILSYQEEISPMSIYLLSFKCFYLENSSLSMDIS